MRRITEVVPYKNWFNKETGEKLSCSSLSLPSNPDLYELRQTGWTVVNADGTRGRGGPPFKTKADADFTMKVVNRDCDMGPGFERVKAWKDFSLYRDWRETSVKRGAYLLSDGEKTDYIIFYKAGSWAHDGVFHLTRDSDVAAYLDALEV